MKKSLLFLSGLFAASTSLHAAPLFSDDFNSYSTGNLVGQGGWAQTSTTATSPIQVNASGKAALGTSGQDVYSVLPGGITTYADGTSLYLGLTLNVSAAQATGDYFLHVTPTVGDSSAFLNRLFVKSTAGGFLLGWQGVSSGVLYGTTILSLSTDYRVVLATHAVAGAANDTASIYVNPFADLSVELNNTAYASFAWTGGTENHAVAAVNLRQGTAGNAPTLTVDDLNVSQSFADVTAFTTVPEPTSMALLGLGLTACLLRRRN